MGDGLLGNTNTRLDHAADPRYRDPGGGLVLAAMLPPPREGAEARKGMVGEQSQPLGGYGVSSFHWCCGGISPGTPRPSGVDTAPSPGLGAAPAVGSGELVASVQSGNDFNGPLKRPC